MSLTITDLNRIANLAKLEFDTATSEQMLLQLNNFFSIVEQMQTVDTEKVTPMAHPISAVEDIALHLATDEVSEFNNRQANQQNAPAVENGLFLVPKVIE